MKENNSNILVKTIIFLLFIALSCVIFFGFMEGVKTEIEYTAFGLVLFAELVFYIMVLISSLGKTKKLNSADLISFGAIYFITSFITNCLMLHSIETLKNLLLINAVENIIILIILCIVLLKKNNK